MIKVIKRVVWENFFAHGPWQNWVKAIPKHRFCPRSFAKQTKSYPEHSGLHTVPSKTWYKLRRGWFGKSFLFTVLDKTECKLFRNTGFVHGPRRNWLKAIQNIVFCTQSLAKHDKSHQEGGLEKHFCSRSLTKQSESYSETQVLSTVLGETD